MTASIGRAHWRVWVAVAAAAAAGVLLLPSGRPGEGTMGGDDGAAWASDPAAVSASAPGVVGIVAAAAGGDDDDGPKLEPGLVATISDGTRSVVRLESEPAFALKAGESLHPHVAPAGMRVVYDGRLRVIRPRDYTFRARLAGSVRITVNGTVVLEGTGDGTAEVAGKPVPLPAGAAVLKIEYARTGEPARLALTWECASFRREPVAANVFAHEPARRPADLAAWDTRHAGRTLVEEFSCTACHKADGGSAARLEVRKPADLHKIAGHANPVWVYNWLGDPQAHRPGTTMPKLLPDDAAGKAERFAVAKHLTTSKSAPGKAPAKGNPGKGRELFTTVGCAVCHGESAGKPAHVSLKGVGSKFDAAGLTAFLRNPGGHNAHTRMPNLLLVDKEAADLAAHLLSDRNPAMEKGAPAPKPADLAAAWTNVVALLPEKDRPKADFAQLAPDKQIAELARASLQARQCLTCHNYNEGNKQLKSPLAPPTLATVAKSPKLAPAAAGGCLSTDPGNAPRFTMDDKQRAAIAAYLAVGEGAAAPAPTFAAKASLDRLNCLSCHQRDGAGGLPQDVADVLKKYEKPENAEAVLPPPLTQIGHKIHTPWLNAVLTKARRSRPWMQLRMPQFAGHHVGKLADGLAALDGVSDTDKDPPPSFDKNAIAAGRTITGKSGLGCIGCHYIAGRPSAGTVGPDLAQVQGRLRDDWYRRWMWDPQRIQPGTRMPTIHIDGKSSLKTLLDADADKQIDAVWQYLALGATLPLPDGLEAPKGLTVGPTSTELRLERTFLPECGNRAIAVGFPGGISVGFDAYSCRLGFAWTGGFLDMTPVWANRGGSIAKPMGPTVWTAPKTFPWHFAGSEGAPAPDFGKIAADATVNSNTWFGETPETKRRLRFLGYSLKEKDGVAFRYALDLEEGKSAEISEKVIAVSRATAMGLVRDFRVDLPAGQVGWFLVSDDAAGVKLLDAKGAEVEWPAAGEGRADKPVEGTFPVLSTATRATIFAATAAPKGSVWALLTAGTRKHLIVKFPAGAGEPARLRLEVLVPHRNEPAVIQAAISDAGK